MKQVKITKNISIGIGAFDGVSNSSTTQQENTLYTEIWIGKAKYKYINDDICTMYVIGFFRILIFERTISKDKENS